MPAPVDFGEILDEDYADAVVRLAWAIDRQSGERVLLCAGIELLPKEIPRPLVRPERFVIASPRFFLYARDVVASARRGLTWFDDAARGIAVRPEKDGTFRDASDAKAQRFVLRPLDSEPPGTALTTARISVPFSGDWQESVRAKHLIPDANPMKEWTEAERKTAVEWLARECHVDLNTLPEFTGSIHLIAPNPVFRRIVVRHDEKSSELVVAIVPRAECSLSGLTLLVEEKRTTGIGFVANVPLKDAVVRVRLPHFPAEIRERIIDARRGLLYDGPFGMFGVGFNLIAELASTIRRVEPGGTADVYEVPLVGAFKSTSFVGGNAPTGTATSVLARAAADRRRRQRGATEQKWFRDQAPDAVRALRELVTRAKGQILLCDPYFGAGDLLRMVMAVADPSTEVRILTSARHLKNDDNAVGEALAAKLAEVRAAPPVSPIEIRVMLGKDPAIHDRFVVLDDVTWMLGASINHFGERGTLMVIVPDPTPVRGELEAVWAGSPTLADWLGRRRQGGSPR